MKNLKKKFGKHAISVKQANTIIGGQDYVWCCGPNIPCSFSFTQALQNCGCPPGEFCQSANIYRIYI